MMFIMQIMLIPMSLYLISFQEMWHSEIADLRLSHKNLAALRVNEMKQQIANRF